MAWDKDEASQKAVVAYHEGDERVASIVPHLSAAYAAGRREATLADVLHPFEAETLAKFLQQNSLAGGGRGLGVQGGGAEHAKALLAILAKLERK